MNFIKTGFLLIFIIVQLLLAIGCENSRAEAAILLKKGGTKQDWHRQQIQPRWTRRNIRSQMAIHNQEKLLRTIHAHYAGSIEWRKTNQFLPEV
ncbi:MAG: hypothetical protein ACYSRR_02855 [Planctomycetota bacterium]|jgi:hypothetical protein